MHRKTKQVLVSGKGLHLVQAQAACSGASRETEPLLTVYDGKSGSGAVNERTPHLTWPLPGCPYCVTWGRINSPAQCGCVAKHDTANQKWQFHVKTLGLRVSWVCVWMILMWERRITSLKASFSSAFFYWGLFKLWLLAWSAQANRLWTLDNPLEGKPDFFSCKLEFVFKSQWDRAANPFPAHQPWS